MYLRLNTQFNPFTYDELVKPLADYGKAYKEVEDAYSTLAEQTEAFKNMINRERDKEAYSMHKKYSDDLNAVVEDFSKGMTSDNRSKLINLKKRYSSEIRPIAIAADRKKALVDEQRKVSLENPTMIWRNKASDMRLDDLIKDPTADYGESYSGALLTKRMADAMKHYKESMLYNSDWDNSNIKGLIEKVEQYGLTREDIDIIRENEDAFPEIGALMNSILDSTGIKGWNNQAALDEAKEYLYEGLFAGLGKTNTVVKEDPNHLNPYEEFKLQQERNKANGVGGDNNEDNPEGRGVYFPEITIGTENRDINQFNTKTLKYTVEGNITSTIIEDIDKEIAELNEKKKNSSTSYTGTLGFTQGARGNAGVSTMHIMQRINNLDNQLEIKKNALAEENDIDSKKKLEQEIVDIKKAIQKSYDDINRVTSPATMNNNYNNRISDLEKQKKKEQETINSYYKKYKHLSDNPIEAIQIGLLLDNQMSLARNTSNVINFGNDTKFSTNLINSYITNGKLAQSTGIYEVGEDGKPTSKQLDREDLPENADGLTLLSTNYGLMYGDAEGNKYLISADDYSRRIANESKLITNHLTDFNADNVNNAIQLEGNIFKDGAVYNEEELIGYIKESAEILKSMPTPRGKTKPIIEKDGTISATFKQLNGDIINVVVYDSNTNNPKLAYSSLSDVISGGTGLKTNIGNYRKYRAAELPGTTINALPSTTLRQGQIYNIE